jgi:hypothetical protein
MDDERLAGRCEACDWLPLSQYCTHCKDNRYYKPCGMANFIKKCSEDQKARLRGQKEAEEAEAQQLGRGGRRRQAAVSATPKVKAQAAAEEWLNHENKYDNAHERQPTRADKHAVRAVSGTWPRRRMLDAARAEAAARADADSTPERDARVPQLEEQLRRFAAARAADQKMIRMLQSEKLKLQQQLDAHACPSLVPPLPRASPPSCLPSLVPALPRASPPSCLPSLVPPSLISQESADLPGSTSSERALYSHDNDSRRD